MSNENPGIVILGPTASGKSRLAISLALRFQGEIVNCDAFQTYRGMDIGTAKVSRAEQEQVRHHMLDLQDPDRDFSAGDYQRQAREVIRDIGDRGKLPFIVGGTGFYLRALIDGLFEGPARSEELRTRMRKVIQRKGPQILHRALQRVDPECAERIAQMDAERIVRAYEVYLVSGKSMTWWQQQPRDAFRGYRWLKLGIDLPREQLYEKINQRVDEMFQRGLIGGNAGAFKTIYPRLPGLQGHWIQAGSRKHRRQDDRERGYRGNQEAEPALCQTATHMVSGGPLYPLAGWQAGAERVSETSRRSGDGLSADT